MALCSFDYCLVRLSFYEGKNKEKSKTKPIGFAFSERNAYLCGRILNSQRHDQISYRLAELQENP